MPYRIRKKGSKYCVQHKKKGRWKNKQCSKTKKNAQKAIRLLRGLEHGNLKKRKK